MNVALIILLLVILFILAWALLGKEETAAVKQKPGEPDVLLRRRATDREIEKKYPDERPPHLRRKSDQDILEEVREISGDFKLPYAADETISEASRFRVYHRTLVNAEIYAKKGDFNTAISLYEGVNSRINDIDTNHKISANVDYLQHYRQYMAMRNREREGPIKAEPRKNSREIKLSVDGPFSIPEKIQIGITAPPQPAIDVDKIVEEISRKLNDRPASPDDSSRFKSHIERLENKIDRLSEAHEAAEAVQKPTIIEARYESPVPLILDPKPILDLLEKIPIPRPQKEDRREEKARKEPDGLPGTGKAGPGEPALETEENRLERVTRKDEDEPDEWELLSKYGRDEQLPEEDMSDEDIFAKILSEDNRKDKDDYEILGDKREREERSFDVVDRAKEAQDREDENFYRKFLKHNKRLARELPILKVSYDFTKLPDEFSLAREKNILEYSYYKYKPMLERAGEFIKKRKVKDAINYYKVVMGQNIPPEFKIMIRKNINDLTEYLEKYLSTD